MAKFETTTFNAKAFGTYMDAIPRIRMNALRTSKALKPNQQIRDTFSSQTGTVYGLIPMFGRLDGEPINYDGEHDITAQATTSYERGVVVIGRAQAWTEYDFSEDLTGGVDFMSNVAMQVAEYWEEKDQEILLSILKGIFDNKNAANRGDFISKHTYNVPVEEGSDNMTVTTLNSAIQKASGDARGRYSLVIMNSIVAMHLENENLLEYLKQTDPSGIQSNLALAQWNGRLVLVDDDLTVDSNGLYTTYVLGDGAFDFEDIGAKVPIEMDRNPALNGGMDTLYSRQRKVFAPYGISFTRADMVSNSPTLSELEDGANWELVNDGGIRQTDGTRLAPQPIEDKAIPIVRIQSKG